MADTNITIGLVRFSYCAVWEPRAQKNSKVEKYSAGLLIPKKDKATLTKVKEAIAAAKELGKSSKWGGKIPKMDETLHDGDEEKPDDPAYAGCMYINAKSSKQPGVVDKKRNPITEKDEFYSGCYGYAAINFYPFDADGNKGVACGLNFIMKVKDGEALAGGVSVDEAFEGVKIEEDDDFM